ncbi:MAG: hypothetical protein AB3N28_00800 [Kordiimonas sp.]
MTDAYQICVLKDELPPITLGTMAADSITFNRYNKGLLIAAGKLTSDSIQHDVFMTFAARFRNKAFMKFTGAEKTYFGDFCFINFIPETHTVVFGSVGPVIEVETASLDDSEDKLCDSSVDQHVPHAAVYAAETEVTI